MKKNKLSILLLIIVLLATTCSCGTNNANINTYSVPENIKVEKSGAVAQNDNYTLLWDSQNACILLQNRATGKIYSTIPYDYYQSYDGEEDYKSLNLRSPIKIVCANINTSQTTEHFSDELASENSIHSLKIKNGIRVIYNFKDISVTIPVEYILTDEGVKTRILVSQITEKEELVYEISVAPFFASVKNGDGSYVFVPSGCGALMYTDEERTTRTYKESVYGEDAADQKLEEPIFGKNINLPVFGVSSEDGGMFGIIEGGSELGVISATAGDKQIGYSAASAGFRIRATASTAVKGSNNTTSVVEKVSTSKADIETVSVLYVPLDAGKCSYNDMAEYYRNYLLNKKQLTEKEEENGLFLNVIGGVKVQKSFLGIPYKTVNPATTIQSVNDIVTELSSELENASITVKLNGFTNGGIDGGEIGGGFEIDKALGNKKDLESLYSLCQKRGVTLLMNFDLINFNKSSNGFSTMSDTAKNANLVAIKENRYSLVIHQIENHSDNKYFLARKSLPQAAKKLSQELGKSIKLDGVALDTLGYIAYGDCGDNKYIAKSQISQDVYSIISSFKNNKYKTSTENANIYAADADYIFSAPFSSSAYLAFDAEIPFYQMIMKGNTSMSVESVNLSDNRNEQIVKAALTGAAIEFTVSESFEDAFIRTDHSGLAATTYSDIKDEIISSVSSLQEVWDSVNGENLVKYERNGNIGYSLFSNGVAVYGNLSENDENSPIGNLKGYSFKVVKGAE